MRHIIIICDLSTGAECGWRGEYQRMWYDAPLMQCEVLRDHRNYVLHVSFANAGDMFATCSFDAQVLVSQFMQIWLRLVFSKMYHKQIMNMTRILFHWVSFHFQDYAKFLWQLYFQINSIESQLSAAHKVCNHIFAF